MPSRSPMVASTLMMNAKAAGEIVIHAPGELALPFGVEQIAIGFRHFVRGNQIGVVAERLEVEHLRGPVAVRVLVLGGNVGGRVGLVGLGEILPSSRTPPSSCRRTRRPSSRPSALLPGSCGAEARAVAADEVDIDAVFLLERRGERSRGVIDEQRRVPGDAPFPLRRIDQRLRCGMCGGRGQSGTRRCR